MGNKPSSTSLLLDTTSNPTTTMEMDTEQTILTTKIPMQEPSEDEPFSFMIHLIQHANYDKMDEFLSQPNFTMNKDTLGGLVIEAILEYAQQYHFTPCYNLLAIIKALVEKGANINYMDIYQHTALHYAVATLSMPLIQLLLQNHAQDIPCKDGGNALHIVISSTYDCDQCVVVLARLIAHGMNVNQVNELGETPLHLACKNQQTKKINCLVANHCHVNLKDQAGNTPLTMLFMNLKRNHFEETLAYDIAIHLMKHGATIEDNLWNILSPLSKSLFKEIMMEHQLEQQKIRSNSI